MAHRATIIVSVGGVEILRRQVSGPTLIGRATECDISVPEASLSRRHCRIDPPPPPPPPASQPGPIQPTADEPGNEGGTEPVDDGVAWQLTDLQSRNGTVVNGRRIASAPIRNGDLIRAGRLVLWFGTGEPPAALRLDEPSQAGGRPATPTVSPVTTTPAGELAARAVPGINLPQPSPGAPPATVYASSDDAVIHSLSKPDGAGDAGDSSGIAPVASSNLYAMVNPRPLPVPQPFPRPLVDEKTLKTNATIDEANPEGSASEPGFFSKLFGHRRDK